VKNVLSVVSRVVLLSERFLSNDQLAFDGNVDLFLLNLVLINQSAKGSSNSATGGEDGEDG
jgi:hypothetical protein